MSYTAKNTHLFSIFSISISYISDTAIYWQENSPFIWKIFCNNIIGRRYIFEKGFVFETEGSFDFRASCHTDCAVIKLHTSASFLIPRAIHFFSVICLFNHRDRSVQSRR